MGLFSRKEAKSSRQTAHRPRPSVSSEAQAASLRVRARRRLAGAVALVLAAVIVLPMLLDGEPRPVPAGIEIAVPERNAPFNPDLRAPSVEPATTSDAINQTAASGEAAAEPVVSVGNVGNVAVPTTDLAANTGPTSPPTAASQDKPQTSPQPNTPIAPAPKVAPTTAPPSRDQTAEALAILEGRASAAATPAATASGSSANQTGSFVLQVASYGTESDAKSRLDKLKSQGISNAFIEPATVSGKQTFRLRVGPFDSRAAAQAAQARLRTLGYDNGFITTK